MPAPRLAIAAVVLVTLLAGCSTPDLPEPTATAAQPTLQEQAIAELGPYPADTPWEEGEREKKLQDAADLRWSSISGQVLAARPDVPVEAEVTSAEAEAVRGECMAEEGVPLGDYTMTEFGPVTEKESIAWYTCLVRFPGIPRPLANDEQLGYIYDYWTGYVAPCLAERGANNPPPPSREEFVAQWPNQKWYPAPAGAPGSEQFGIDGEACPATIGDY